ncbi:MAG: L-threonylcarbamoyladenylate synthase [Variibacter sp.]
MISADEPAAAEAAAARLRAGGLVAFPTETVYGLGADATDGAAIARLYAAKGRPRFNPLISHLPDPAAAMRLGIFNAAARALAARFWPGPLTLVVPKAPDCPIASLTTAGLDTVALRVPSHPVAQKILRAAARPIAAPSANRSGRVSPTRAAHVLADFPDALDLIVDGGPTEVGLESTIVACVDETPVLLRLGGLAREAIESALGQPVARVLSAGEAPQAPGQLASHYAPRATIRLNATHVARGEALLTFAGARPDGADGAAMTLDLSPRGDLVEAAANFFSYLHRLDASGARAIAVVPIPEQGLGEAINDRLRRAAAPRPPSR